MSRLQKSVALSTTEAEYMVIAEAAKELVWLKSFLAELGLQQDNCVLHCDNQSTVHLAKNPVFHSGTKHIQMRYHFILKLIKDGTVNLQKNPWYEESNRHVHQGGYHRQVKALHGLNWPSSLS